MGQITGGSVTYGRTAKVAEYESKRADVTLAFSVGDGEDHEVMLAKAALLAHAKCHEMLGQKAPAATNDPAPRKTKTDKDKLVEEKIRSTSAPPATALAASDPAAIEPPKAEAEKSAGPATVEDWAGEAGEVTDETLMNAITKKNAAIKNPPAIRALIGKYVAPPKQAREIPQEKRAAFLAELDALKPAQAA